MSRRELKSFGATEDPDLPPPESEPDSEGTGDEDGTADAVRRAAAVIMDTIKAYTVYKK